jgi:hypothetical protein
MASAEAVAEDGTRDTRTAPHTMEFAIDPIVGEFNLRRTTAHPPRQKAASLCREAKYPMRSH